MLMSADFLLIYSSHNQFLSDNPFPQIDVLSDGFKELCAIIAKYNTQSQFRLRLLHRHTTIPKGYILLGISITKPLGYWTRSIYISNINLQQIYGYIFSLDTTSFTNKDNKKNAFLFPFEFCEDLPLSIGNIDSNFFTEFTKCFWIKGLENTLGFEAIQGQAGKTIEFSFDIGSLLLQEEEVKANVRGRSAGQFKHQETGWAIIVKDEMVYKTGETRCFTFETGYVKVTDSKIKGWSDALKILRDEGVLAM